MIGRSPCAGAVKQSSGCKERAATLIHLSTITAPKVAETLHKRKKRVGAFARAKRRICFNSTSYKSPAAAAPFCS